MKTSNQQSLAEVIKDLLKQYRLEQGLDEVRLKKVWGTLMGEFIARRTKEIRLKDKTLFIYMDSSVVREELMFARTKIIEMLNKEFGKPLISEIVIR